MVSYQKKKTNGGGHTFGKNADGLGDSRRNCVNANKEVNTSDKCDGFTLKSCGVPVTVTNEPSNMEIYHRENGSEYIIGNKNEFLDFLIYALEESKDIQIRHTKDSDFIDIKIIGISYNMESHKWVIEVRSKDVPTLRAVSFSDIYQIYIGN